MSLMGNTAYCGSLLLAALEAADEMAGAMGETVLAESYANWLDQARTSFETKLWNGTYYNIDTASTAADRIMADQLAGEWYARACGLPPVVPEDHARSAFQAIYDNNFKKFDSGTHGVVNVMTASGTTDSPPRKPRRSGWGRAGPWPRA